jgi:hypothetical protein
LKKFIGKETLKKWNTCFWQKVTANDPKDTMKEQTKIYLLSITIHMAKLYLALQVLCSPFPFRSQFLAVPTPRQITIQFESNTEFSQQGSPITFLTRQCKVEFEVSTNQ